MIAESFSYHRPQRLDEAIRLLQEHGDSAKVLAGGHSLIPAMKLKLARPGVLVDLAAIDQLSGIHEADGSLRIGAMTTHGAIAQSRLLAEQCPLLPQAAMHIGDRQVRNWGTVGGSLVHADPTADWPAVMLALDATLEVVGPSGSRDLRADEFFVDMLQTAIAPEEILIAIRVRPTPASVAYVKTEQKASGFALCGVAVVLDAAAQTARVGITGVAPVPYRASRTEALLAGQTLTAEAVAKAAEAAADGIDALGDIHASAEYRRHLAEVNTRRALARAIAPADT